MFLLYHYRAQLNIDRSYVFRQIFKLQDQLRYGSIKEEATSYQSIRVLQTMCDEKEHI